ncbi:phosphatase PAP2 family protein [Corynebacterium sp. FDAARGOS 1242]|uniref:phosphatase PAP2 family protein n=1 Tax=Corynebacterium sp. FDAARGOS 1242 TaxID=2778078 RepID=UPI001950293A|nr:phosphatase PAP2 family protein [Corynebacterium sp. FDAARGOS 1242]QRP98338.1 phosphatase PAP2 family protein [Corynebacterium sp. FDAARGOS 1242]
MPTFSRALAAPIAAVLVVTSAQPAALAADLPFTIPALADPMTGSSTGEAPVQHPGAPTPRPFTPDYLVGFPSDVSSYQYGVYWEVVRLYDDIKTNPTTMAEDLDKAVAINNAAAGDATLIARAQRDAAADTDGVMAAVSDAMGPELGQAFRDALAEHRLPKTEYLLGNGYLARAGGLASSTFAEKHYFKAARPFQQAPDRIKRYNDGRKNYYLDSPAFPSGHTNQAVWVTTLLASMLPEVGPQLALRGVEAGNRRVVMGVHSPLDVIGGRMTGLAAAADRLNDPRMRDALHQAEAEIRAEIQWRTGKDIVTLVDEQNAAGTTYTTAAQAAERYEPMADYGLSTVYHPDAPMIVPKAAPVLLEAAHPNLNYEQRADVLRQTATAPGTPLDWQGASGSWQRINLVKALGAHVSVDADGNVHVAQAM